MTTEQLYARIKEKKSMLCVGLDTDFNKLPEPILKQALGKERSIVEFNKAIVDALSLIHI